MCDCHDDYICLVCNPYKNKEKIKDIIKTQLLYMDWKYQYQILNLIGEENEGKLDEIVLKIMNLY
tara:strand:- start:6024 stop:6218 length:195 start_codon:yes stop_codon:yes gene_type:complete